mmetsp:Transcript_4246/g.7197  ORF Transcript_4246/g.7197 Transcript_4246/m.7197 type:complete len:98 (-) Transcript_4246:671-964(-)
MAQDMEEKRKREEEMLSKIDGKFEVIVTSLVKNESPNEYSLTGVELGSARCEMLAKCVAFNNSLLSLHLASKKLNDTDGVIIAKILFENSTLRKLEL